MPEVHYLRSNLQIAGLSTLGTLGAFIISWLHVQNLLTGVFSLREILPENLLLNLKGINTARVLAVGSRDLHRSKEFASTFGIERYYGSYEELVS